MALIKKVYFPNLNGFRFFAAALVILSHIELFKKKVGLYNLWNTPFFFEAGSGGVDFFFVLSGFLITTLLLKEQERTGTIALRKFYMRRVLRIWPLYYLIIIICYFVVPQIHAFYIAGYSEILYDRFFSKLLYSVFFMPNVALSFFEEIPYAAPLWSVGVEEQFYLFWPILLLRFSKKLRLIGYFILLFVGIKACYILLNSILPLDKILFEKIKNLLVATRMECMGIGGLGAYLVYKKYWIGEAMKSNVALAVALILLPFTILFAKYLLELHHIVFAILFLIVIINGATNSNTPLKFENKIFLMLGNISYGLYLWHSICLGLVINFLRNIEGLTMNNTLFNLTLYIGTFATSILIAWLSYTYFETPFLRIKSKFTVIVSGSEARNNKVELRSPEN